MDIDIKKNKNYLYNCRKLWMLYQINESFRFTIELLRKKWNIDIKNPVGKDPWDSLKIFEDKSYQKTMNTITSLDKNNKIQRGNVFNTIYYGGFSDTERNKYFYELLADNYKNFPLLAYQRDIKNLMREFHFDENWKYHLQLFLITNLITAPSDKKDRDAPSDKTAEHVKYYKEIHKKTGKSMYDNPSDRKLKAKKIKYPGTYLDVAADIWDSNSADDGDSISYSKEFQNVKDKKILVIRKTISRLKKSDFFNQMTEERKKSLKAMFFPE